MKQYIPPITRRVILALVVLGFGVGTNYWHRNIVSGLGVSITAIALAVWLGTELGKGR